MRDKLRYGHIPPSLPDGGGIYALPSQPKGPKEFSKYNISGSLSLTTSTDIAVVDISSGKDQLLSAADHQYYLAPRTSMHSLGSTRLVFNLLPVPISLPLRRQLSSLRSANLFSSISTFTRTYRQLPRRAFSCVSDSPNDLFNYTSGRWLQVLCTLFSGVYV